MLRSFPSDESFKSKNRKLAVHVRSDTQTNSRCGNRLVMLIVTIWLERCTSYGSSCYHHLSHIQNGEILLPAYPSFPWKMAVSWSFIASDSLPVLTAIVPDKLGLASTRMSPFWILLELRMMF